MSEFNLIYYQRVTGIKYIGKRVSQTDYILKREDGLDKRELSHYYLHKEFISDEKNKSFKILASRNRTVRTDSKAFRDYLRGSE